MTMQFQMMPGRLTDNANTKGHAIDFIKIGVDPKDGSMGDFNIPGV